VSFLFFGQVFAGTSSAETDPHAGVRRLGMTGGEL